MCPTLPVVGELCAEYPQPFFSEIDSSVAVPVVVTAANWAVPLPDTQVLQVRIDMTAHAAPLAAGKKPVRLHHTLSYHWALYSNWRTSSPHDASAIDLATL